MTLMLAAAPLGAIDATFVLRVLSCATVVWLLAAAAAWVLRRVSSAAVRHRVWSLSCLIALALPVVIQTVPQWRVGPRRSRLTPMTARPAPDSSQAAGALGTMVEITRVPDADAELPGPELPTIGQSETAASPVPRPAGPAEKSVSSHPTQTPAAQPPSTTLVRQPIPWTRICQIGWAALAAWLIVRQMMSMRAARVVVRRAKPIAPNDLEAVASLTRIARRFGVGAPPALAESDQISSPICVGLLRPFVLLPTTWRDWSASELETVLAHELAHITRHDVAWQTLARFTAALYWFNPLAWVAVWRMRVERELACDDWVLRHGESSTTYARCLVDVAAVAMRRRAHPAQVAGVAMAAAGGLERRLVAILDPARRRSPLTRRTAVALTVTAAVVATAIGVINPWAPRAAAADAGATAAKPATAPSPAVGDSNERVLNLSGRVEDPQGRPVAGVYVHVVSGIIEQSVRSGADGHFSAVLKDRRDGMRYVNVRATTLDGALQTFRQLYDPKGDGHITDEEARDVRLVLRPAREFPVTVTDGQRQPVADAWVAFSAFYMKAGEARTDALGKATLRVPADAPPMNAMASKAGVGLDYVSFWRPEEAHTDPYRLAPDYTGPLQFVLGGAKTVTVKVVDDQERPLANVSVRPWYFVKPKRGGDFNQGITELTRTTNAQGLATFDYIPADLSGRLGFWTFLDGYAAPHRCIYDPTVEKTDLQTTMLRRVRIAGRVLDENGGPVAGATMRYYGNGYGTDACFGMVETGADGAFATMVDADMYYLIGADKGHLASRALTRIVRRASPNPIELTLKPATRIFGRATLDEKGAPIPDVSIQLSQRGEDPGDHLAPGEEPLTPPDVGDGGPQSINLYLFRKVPVDASGAFEVYAAPGKYSLSASGTPRVSASAELNVTNQEQVEVNLRPNERPRVALKLVRGRVVRRDKPDLGVPFVTVTGYSMKFDENPVVISDKEGNFEIRHGGTDLYLFAESEDKSVRGIATVHAGDASVAIPVGPTASASGRLLDHDGAVAAGRNVQSGVHIGAPTGPSTEVNADTTTTAVDGTFTINGLVPGAEYQLRAMAKKIDGQPQTSSRIGTIKPDTAGRIELGDRTLPKPLIANQPKSWKDAEKEAFAPLDPIEQRLSEARDRARVERHHVLVLLGAPGQSGCDEFFQFAGDPARYDVRRPLADYTLVAVNCLLTEPDAATWVERANVAWPARAMSLAVLDPDGKVIAQSTFKSLAVNDKLDRKRLIDFLSRNVPAPIPSTAVKVERGGGAIELDPGRTGYLPALKLPAPAAVAWRIRAEPRLVGGRLRWPGMTNPVVSGGVVYFGDDVGAVRAVRSNDGAPVWTRDQGERVNAPFLDEERVYFTTSSGLAAIRRSDGKPVWQIAVEHGASEAGGVVWPATDTLFYAAGDGFLYAVDRRTGKSRWKHSLVDDRPADPKGFDGDRARLADAAARPTGIATDGTTVFQSVFDQSRVVAVDGATGQRRWAFQARGWIYGSPAVSDNHVFVGSQDGNLYCLDKGTGKQVWSFGTRNRVESAPSVAEGRVYVPSCDGSVYCVDEATGRQVWAFATDAGPNRTHAIYSTPILTADAVYFAAGEGQLYALERATGKVITAIRPTDAAELFCSPATDGVRLFLTTRPALDQSGETSVIAVGP